MSKITLAMPVYNVEGYIERALLSALNQTYDNYEVLVIDDKGADNSMDVVCKVQKEHPRGGLIRIVEHAQNRGTGATRNTAIDEAQGEYLMYMDSDDEITPDCLEIHYRAIKETDADFTAGERIIIFSNGHERKGRSVPNKFLLLNTQHDVIKYFFCGAPRSVVTWNRLYKLSFLKKNNIRCIDHHFFEDNLFSFQIRINAKKVALFPDITYKYYARQESTVNTFKLLSKKRFLDKIETAEQELHYSQYLNTDCIHIKDIMNHISNNYIHLYSTLQEFKKSNTELPSRAEERIRNIYQLTTQRCGELDKIRLYIITHMPHYIYKVTNYCIYIFQKRGWLILLERIRNI